MEISDARLDGAFVSVRFADGASADYPPLFLVDNDPAGFHDLTWERMNDLLDAPESPAVERLVSTGDTLTVHWRHGGRPAVFPASWLYAHRPGVRPRDPAEVVPESWGAAEMAAIPRFDAETILADPDALFECLLTLKRRGLVVIAGLDDDERAGARIGEEIAFLKLLNFGQTFRVEVVADPNSLAYTTERLPPHSDLPNHEAPPRYQFLHCVRDESTGGEGLFIDGYRLAERLREEDPEAFRILSTVPVPFHFRDTAWDIRWRRPAIELTPGGEVTGVYFSVHGMDVWDMEPALMQAYYRAFRTMMRLTRDPSLMVRRKSKAGEMVAFDNRRVLHGREAFDTRSGGRLLIGFYLDHADFDGKLRKLHERREALEAAR